MPRFVILVHDWPAWHWDFFLEAGPILKAWRLWAEPGYGKDVPAEPMFDHRLFYLDYEGPLSDGRGSVTRWDAGTFEWHSTEFLRVRLFGGKIKGIATIVSDTWRVERDVPPAGSGDHLGGAEVE
jgi:hypothetical protein